jgi:hypothetical protein
VFDHRAAQGLFYRFQAADEFLILRDLLAEDDFEQVCKTLYHFLWREAQRGVRVEGTQRGADGEVWIDPDRRLVQVWFATDRKPVQVDDIVERFDSERSVNHSPNTWALFVGFILVLTARLARNYDHLLLAIEWGSRPAATLTIRPCAPIM